MRISRTLAGVLSAALLGAVPVSVVAAPAHAATPVVVEIAPQYSKVVYGTKSDFSAAVRTSDGASVSTGTIQLQGQIRGKSWKTVRTAQASGYVFIDDVKPTEGTNYRIVYSDSSGAYATATSKTVRIKVARKITKPTRGLVLKGKVSPKFKKKKLIITVSKKEKKGYKKFRTIRTNKKGKYRIKLPARRGTWYYKVTVPGDKRFVKNWYGWKVWSY